uniref:Uncharacterized protein n=1 Tax=Populus trichocarpa TaxID=3694 RepID=A9PGA6_POPTR|nr:unknown [Populus trichocarpa]
MHYLLGAFLKAGIYCLFYLPSHSLSFTFLLDIYIYIYI